MDCKNRINDSFSENEFPAEQDIAPYCRGLNQAQLSALLHFGSPLLILAGAGSGKTRVITTKIAYLVDQKKVDPRSILGVTFTNKAAGEMRERVKAMVPEAEEVMLRTFHSFGAWVLRRHAKLLDLDPQFAIYDDDDSVNLLQTLYPGYSKKELKPFARRISRAKDYCFNSESDLSEISNDPRLPKMYADYEKKIRSLGNVDFGDLIMRCVELLQNYPEVRERIRSRFQVILVDEYQDSNVAQFALLQELVGEHTYLCVVGDDDQSIYRFRGAEVRNILSFPEHFPGTEIIRLEENYRSTGIILSIAHSVVENNKGRLGKTLWTRQAAGQKGVIAFLDDQYQEAGFCAQLVADGNYEETAILYRTNAQSAAFESAFTRLGIPYQVVGALRFYEREEVKDILAMIAVFMNPRDELAFRRIINKPGRGIGPKSVESIVRAAPAVEGNLLQMCRLLIEAEEDIETDIAVSLTKRGKQGLQRFVDCFNSMQEVVEDVNPAELLKKAISQSGLYDYYRQEDRERNTQKVNNLQELVSAAFYYPKGRKGLLLFLEDAELDRSHSSEQESSHGVTLITMHSTKGLEFQRVIITGMEEGLFPGRDEDELEEERRIFYVAITRAKKEIYFTGCRNRTIWGRNNWQMPSRFLNEIPIENIKTIDDGFSNGYSPGYFTSRGGKQIDSRGFSNQFGRKERKEGKKRAGIKAEQVKKTAAVSGFTQGNRVYHDDYGPGVVTDIVEKDGELAVVVKYDTGRSAVSVPRFSSLERIAHD